MAAARVIRDTRPPRSGDDSWGSRRSNAILAGIVQFS
jgi:hypothetical protein